MSSCLRYHPVTKQWQETVSLDTARQYATSVRISDEEWWIAGGSNYRHETLDSSLIYAGGKFYPGPKLPYATRGMCGVKVNITHILVAGGESVSSSIEAHRADAYLLNWVTKTWTKLPDMKERRVHHACGVANGRVVVIGSSDRGNFSRRTGEIHEPGQGRWYAGPELPDLVL